MFSSLEYRTLVSSWINQFNLESKIIGSLTVDNVSEVTPFDWPALMCKDRDYTDLAAIANVATAASGFTLIKT